MKNKDPCKPFACRIQDCLKRHSFQESACQDVIEDMRQCCIKWGNKSFVCEGIKTDKPQTTQRKDKTQSQTLQ